MTRKSPDSSKSPSRVVSIDVLRGLTILVMIFVNDLAGVAGAPGWMKHFFPHDADGMTFVDVVFPAFLFIVGMAIPFALGGRLDRGERLVKVWIHVLIRTLGLLIIGFFMVNSYTVAKDGLMNPHLWTFLTYLCVILVWNTPPKEPGRKRTVVLALRGAGIAGLIALALVYRGNNAAGAFQMRTQWWGILGLIGWAYLVASVAYTLFRRSMAGLIGSVVVLYCVFIADRAGFFNALGWLKQWVDIGSMLGSQAAITVSGVVLGLVLRPDSPVKSHWARIRWGLVYGAFLWVAGCLLYSLHDIHGMFIINKNAATPPWCLISSAWTVWIWVAIYILVDVQGWKTWAVILQPGGENPLFAYILQPMVYAGFGLLAMALAGFDFYARLGEGFAVGFWRALVFAFLVTWLAGWLKNLGLRLRL